jgi:lysophospholipase L1-like esterase
MRRIVVRPFVSIAILLVASVCVAKDSPATVKPVPRDPNWVKRHEQINANVKKAAGKAELVFIGDSITDGWQGGGKDVWAKYYGDRHALNLGIGGDQTQHVLWRLENGNLDGITPKLAVVMIGTNNAHSASPEDIAAGVKAILDKIHDKSPDTKILLLAVFPRGADDKDKLRQVNMKTNDIIAKYADNKTVYYLDIGPKFLDSDHKLSKDIMPDLLHPNKKGYEIWAAAIEPSVAKLLGDKAKSAK